MSKQRIYSLMDLITKLMVINFLWFLTLLMGMFVFTIFPATAALFITVKKQLEHSLAYSEITKLFFSYFKKNFLKFSILGIFLTLFFLITLSNFIFIFNFRDISMVRYVLRPAMIFIALIGIIVLSNIFIINAYEDLSAKELFRKSIQMGLKTPYNGLWRSLIFTAIALVVFLIPGLLPLISMNALAVISVWIYPKPTV